MRLWIDLIEGQTPAVSADYVIQYVADLNDRDDPYEGEVPERIAKYNSFHLVNFPINKLDLDGYQYDPVLATEYANMTSHTSPPIVIEPDGEIIDGFHRAQAAIIRGDDTIEAYVGMQ